MRKISIFILTVLSLGLILSACSSGKSDVNDRRGGGGQNPSIVRASVDSSGDQANADSSNPSISSTGRYVTFESLADDLIGLLDTNGASDIFVHDRDADTDGTFDEDEPGAVSTVRVSVDSTGDQADFPVASPASFNPSISSTGRYVVFESLATDLVITPNTTASRRHIYLHDRDVIDNGVFDELGDISTVLVSIDTISGEGDSSSFNPSISPNGQFVVFESLATDLVPQSITPGRRHIYVYDRDDNGNGTYDEPGDITIMLVSVNTGGFEGDDDSFNPSVSDNGFVAFDSLATDLVTTDLSGDSDVFVFDHNTGSTIRVSNDSIGNDADNGSFNPSISSTGRFIAFDSFASDLVLFDINSKRDIFVHDRDTDADSIFDELGFTDTTRVSVPSVDPDANDNSFNPDISATGRFVVFESIANNLVTPNTIALRQHVYMIDRDVDGDGIFYEAGDTLTELISVTSDGLQEGNLDSFTPSVSDDGRHTVFGSDANNLVTPDVGGLTDIIVRDRNP